jgi:hypothetical protein
MIYATREADEARYENRCSRNRQDVEERVDHSRQGGNRGTRCGAENNQEEAEARRKQSEPRQGRSRPDVRLYKGRGNEKAKEIQKWCKAKRGHTA